jgi:hypothetical protein
MMRDLGGGLGGLGGSLPIATREKKKRPFLETRGVLRNFGVGGLASDTPKPPKPPKQHFSKWPESGQPTKKTNG